MKWAGTIFCLIGIGFTALNIYPMNIFLSLFGSVLWALAGIYQRDVPLFIVEGVAVALYLIGVINWIGL